MKKIKTRYAPSPTGNQHIGGLRTAIFAYLWAKKNKGDFLLRIEDTDRERIVPGAVKKIEESLSWLGLEIDEEIIYQSDRREIHLKYAMKLIEKGLAYKCFCTKERLEKLREEQINKKSAPGYDGRCRYLSLKELNEHEQKSTPYVIRIAMPKDGRAEWVDGVRGKMSIDFSTIDDQVLVKSDGWPTYFLASVVDDYEAGVTDVIRGEEWLPSTPKNIALYNAFGWDLPRFIHLPVILGNDGKKKLSKRDGGVSVEEYQKMGYLPDAILNFLALLGWNPGTTQEIFSKNELIDLFSLERIQKSPAVFDIKRLDWINGQYIRKMSNDKLKNSIQKLIPDLKMLELPNFERILEIEKTRLNKLIDLKENSDFYFKTPKLDKETLVFKKSNDAGTTIGLEASIEALKSIAEEDWSKLTVDEFNTTLSKIVEQKNLTNGDLFWPIRYALSGLEKSPSPAELLWALGKNESLTRLTSALKNMKKGS